MRSRIPEGKSADPCGFWLGIFMICMAEAEPIRRGCISMPPPVESSMDIPHLTITRSFPLECTMGILRPHRCCWWSSAGSYCLRSIFPLSIDRFPAGYAASMKEAAALPEAASPAKEPISEAAAPKAEEKQADDALPDSARPSTPKSKKRKKERCVLAPLWVLLSHA